MNRRLGRQQLSNRHRYIVTHFICAIINVQSKERSSPLMVCNILKKAFQVHLEGLVNYDGWENNKTLETTYGSRLFNYSSNPYMPLDVLRNELLNNHNPRCIQVIVVITILYQDYNLKRYEENKGCCF